MTPSLSAPSTAWVASLSFEHRDNWTICQQSGLWGTPNPSGHKIQAGDEIFIWQSQGGWLARCIANTDAYAVDEANPAPWSDRSDYKWLMGITLIAEADPPIWRASPGGWQIDTGLHTSTFRALGRIEATKADAVRDLFPQPTALATRPVVAAREPTGGWGRGSDRERNKRIEQAGINEAIRFYGQQGFDLTRDCQNDGVGYDLQFARGADEVHAEVKGIAGQELTFNLTAKERDMASTDPHFRLIAVNGCLGTPSVTVLTGAELLRMDLRATQYRVRPV